MERREALKLLAGSAFLPFLSPDALALFRAVHQDLPEIVALKTLNPHQNATVTTIAELIIPQTDTPGAKAVRVNEFIDLILTDWYDEEEKSIFLAGLADVDIRSHQQFGKDFVDCSEKQQGTIVSQFDQELGETRRTTTAPWSRRLPKHKHFFFMMKRLTLVGYYTSEIGFEQELRESVIPPRHAGCAAIEEEATN
jgi:hypothetical protein